MSTLARRQRRSADIWPGFVDALTSLIMVMIFVLLIFAIGQFALSDTLAGKNQALDALNARVAELARNLSLSESDKRALDQRVAELSASLGSSQSERERLGSELAAATDQARLLGNDIAALQELKRQLEAEAARLSSQLDSTQSDLVKQTELGNAATAQVELLNRQLSALREQLARVEGALGIANKDIAAKDARWRLMLVPPHEATQ